MAILRVEFNNILCFKDFKADFSYSKKLVKTNLQYEYLKNYPNIRYKKVNIIIGSNATGKTSLGKVIWKTFMFIRDKEAKPLLDLVNNKDKDASILMDCVFSTGLFLRFEAIIKPNNEIDVRYHDMKLRVDDTYESIIKRIPDKEFESYLIGLKDATMGGWNFAFPSIEMGFDYISTKVNKDKRDEYIKTLCLVLKTFDPSIKDVTKSNDIEDAYVIKFSDARMEIIRHGYRLSELHNLSSGTKHAINIANVMFSIKNHTNGFYYIDEQFSYVNSDIEIACLNTMIDLLGDGEQLFFTSHNEQLMELPYPLHTFSFLKKEEMNGDYHIELVNASQFEKRNNVSVKNLYDNDCFNLSVDTKKIFELLN